MIVREERDGGILVYDNGDSIRNLDTEELQRMVEFYHDLKDTLKRNNNIIAEGIFAGSGITHNEPRVGAGFFYDGIIKYGTYSYNGEKKTHEITEEEKNKITSRLQLAEAKLRKKQYIGEMLEKVNPFSKGRKK